MANTTTTVVLNGQDATSVGARTANSRIYADANISTSGDGFVTNVNNRGAANEEVTGPVVLSASDFGATGNPGSGFDVRDSTISYNASGGNAEWTGSTLMGFRNSLILAAGASGFPFFRVRGGNSVVADLVNARFVGRQQADSPGLNLNGISALTSDLTGLALDGFWTNLPPDVPLLVWTSVGLVSVLTSSISSGSTRHSRMTSGLSGWLVTSLDSLITVALKSLMHGLVTPVTTQLARLWMLHKIILCTS